MHKTWFIPKKKENGRQILHKKKKKTLNETK